jgi:hypothetical protein
MSVLTSRAYVLNDAKRKTIIALIANGSSRRAAAELARAEQATEVSLLRSVHAAAKETKHWRAAAWLLERRNPEDFAPRPLNLFTEQQMADMISQIVEIVHGDLTDETYRRAMEKLDELLAEADSLKKPILVESDADDFDAPPFAPKPDSWPQLTDSGSATESVECADEDSATRSTNASHPPEEQIDLRDESTLVT